MPLFNWCIFTQPKPQISCLYCLPYAINQLYCSMPSHSNSSPLALLPLGFMLAYTLVHKYCCQTWRMGLCQFLTWCQKGPCHRLMNGNHTGHWFGVGECRPSGKLTEKEACYRTCRSWKLWSQINVGGSYMERPLPSPFRFGEEGSWGAHWCWESKQSEAAMALFPTSHQRQNYSLQYW